MFGEWGGAGELVGEGGEFERQFHADDGDEQHPRRDGDIGNRDDGDPSVTESERWDADGCRDFGDYRLADVDGRDDERGGGDEREWGDQDRKSGGEGKRGDLGGRRISKKKKGGGRREPADSRGERR